MMSEGRSILLNRDLPKDLADLLRREGVNPGADVAVRGDGPEPLRQLRAGVPAGGAEPAAHGRPAHGAIPEGGADRAGAPGHHRNPHAAGHRRRVHGRARRGRLRRDPRVFERQRGHLPQSRQQAEEVARRRAGGGRPGGRLRSAQVPEVRADPRAQGRALPALRGPGQGALARAGAHEAVSRLGRADADRADRGHRPPDGTAAADENPRGRRDQ